MRRLVFLLGVLATVVVGGYFAFDHFKIYLPGLISRLQDPPGPYQDITFVQGATVPATLAEGATRPPNIIVILADDLGYNDLSLHGGGVGGGQVQTPNINALALEGAEAPVAYAANATCSPSRAAIMTGRYPTRFGFEFTAVPVAFARNIARQRTAASPPVIFYEDRTDEVPPYPEEGVPASEITIAEVLRETGYHTVHLGKWHLGEAAPLRPEAQGFAESLGFVAGGSMFLDPKDPGVVNARLPWDPIDRFIWANLKNYVQYNGGKRFPANEYMTDYLTHAAVKVIEANKHQPFFLYLAYNAPHTPLQATQADYDALSGIADHNERVYGAMIRALDRGVGEVMQALKDNGVDENTLVIFTSDNGGAWYAGLPDLNKPFRGWKATFFEGGVRVPYFLRWPARIPAGTRIEAPAQHMDIFATAAAAAGAESPDGRDGIDLLRLLPGAEAPPERPLFWRSSHYRVVRAGGWKLQLSERPAKVWLHDLSADPTEQTNLAEQRPDKVAELKALIEAHEQKMPAPLWPALLEGPVRIDQPMNAPWQEGQDYVYWAN